MNNFILKFGKHKGEQFLNTPKSYQEWLLNQDWFKEPKSEARYDVVRKFVKEYAIGMGQRYERVEFNLTWEQANIVKDNMNLSQIDDLTDYFYIEPSK